MIRVRRQNRDALSPVGSHIWDYICNARARITIASERAEAGPQMSVLILSNVSLVAQAGNT